MGLFVLTCIDHADAMERRLEARPAHLDYVRANAHLVKLAGPLLNDGGEMTGSLFIMEARSAAEIEAFVAGDPYGLANVFESAEIRGFKVSVGALA